MQNQNMNSQNMVQGAGFVAPPPLPDYQPPPPPPPVQTMQPPVQAMHQPSERPAPATLTQTHNLQQPPPKVQIDSEQKPDSSLKMNEPQTAQINQTQTSVSVLSQDKNFNFEQTHSQYNQDGFRRNNRNSRWGNNNNGGSNSGNNNRNNRMFGGHTNFNNRNSTPHDDRALIDQDNDEEKEEKSQEEIAFDIQFQKWEDQLAEWKRSNANHPDRNQYNDFVMKMEDCRKQLLQRRETLRQKRLDRNRNAQLVQNLQNNPQTMNKNEISTESLDQENVSQTKTTANSFESEEPIASNLFSSERCDSNAAIPGLDLVSGDDVLSQTGSGGPPPPSGVAPLKCESTKSDTDSNIVARVTNILGNPEIQSLLSNIQKQKIETATLQSNIQTRDSNENDGQSGGNVSNLPDNLGHFDKQQNTDEHQRNPFRQNTRFDVDMSTQNSNQHEMNPKRGRYDFENTVNDRSEFDRFDRFNRFDRDRNDLLTKVNLASFQ